MERIVETTNAGADFEGVPAFRRCDEVGDLAVEFGILSFHRQELVGQLAPYLGVALVKASRDDAGQLPRSIHNPRESGHVKQNANGVRRGAVFEEAGEDFRELSFHGPPFIKAPLSQDRRVVLGGVNASFEPDGAEVVQGRLSARVLAFDFGEHSRGFCQVFISSCECQAQSQVANSASMDASSELFSG